MNKFIALYYNYEGDFIIKPYNDNLQGYFIMYLSHNYCKVVEYMEQIKSINIRRINIRRIKNE